MINIIKNISLFYYSKTKTQKTFYIVEFISMNEQNLLILLDQGQRGVLQYDTISKIFSFINTGKKTKKQESFFPIQTLIIDKKNISINKQTIEEINQFFLNAHLKQKKASFTLSDKHDKKLIISYL